MATVNFSVPDEIKERFNKVFADANKSSVIAQLMEETIERELARRRRIEAVDRLLTLRAQTPPVAPAAIQRARNAGRD